MKSRWLLVALALGLIAVMAVSLTGCPAEEEPQQAPDEPILEGYEEPAGEAVDEISDEAEEIGDEVEEDVEAAGEEIEETAQDVEEEYEQEAREHEREADDGPQ